MRWRWLKLADIDPSLAQSFLRGGPQFALCRHRHRAARSSRRHHALRRIPAHPAFAIIHDDELGKEFAERLIERANAGVKIRPFPRRCRLLFSAALAPTRNDCARLGSPPAVLQPPPPHPAFPRSDVHPVPQSSEDRRARRQGRPGSAGLYVGDEYRGPLKRFGPWRDTHVRIRTGRTRRRPELPRRWQWATNEEITGPLPHTK